MSKTRSFRAGDWACRHLSGGFILAYHDLSPEAFELQIDALCPYKPVHISDLVRHGKTRQAATRLFAITCDDGVATTVRHLSEVCIKRGWPISFYLPTGYLDDPTGLPFQQWQILAPHLPHAKIQLSYNQLDLSTEQKFIAFSRSMQITMYTQPRDRYAPLVDELRRWVLEKKLATDEQLAPPAPISWKEVEELSRNELIHFESHGVTHTAVIALDRDQLGEELTTSARRIAEHTNRDCQHFCYPYGGRQSIGQVAPCVVGKRFETAVTMLRGRLGGHSRWLLPRIPIYERDTPDVARLKVLTV
jgi:peptidoglycan/xylan/chitin deacetylase (PgdA/CDA1 family)